jgi:hypothetical protein
VRRQFSGRKRYNRGKYKQPSPRAIRFRHFRSRQLQAQFSPETLALESNRQDRSQLRGGTDSITRLTAGREPPSGKLKSKLQLRPGPITFFDWKTKGFQFI